ncbi:MAG: OmpA family protein [Terriglobia bacterium]|nr:OmpA family protein [Terriglobia bacterium]
MVQKSLFAVVLSAAMGITATVAAQTDSSAESSTPQQDQQIQVTPMDQTPVYRVQVVERTTDAIDYRHRARSTINIHGTSLDPNITGKAKINSKNGRIAVEAKLNHMNKPESYGPQYLTYVLWAITPEGRPSNLGEVLPNDDGNAELHVTTNLQAFGLIVTAEPYFAVTAPSNLVVADNIITQKTQGWAQPIHARFEAVNRSEYTVDIPASELPATAADRKKVPLELLEARNAVAIAKATGARQYASDALDKAEDFLSKGEDYLNRKQPKSAIATVARYATQQAEDARLLTIRDKRQEQAEKEREQIRQRAENAEQQADEAQQRAQEARQQAEDEAARARAAQDQLQQTQQQTQETQQQLTQAQQELAQAQAAQQTAQQAAQQAAQERAAAEQARQQALMEQQNLRQQAQQAQMQAQQAEMQREQTRQRLLSQLNQVLQTRDTARGLIVNMSDVLFDFNRASLKPGAKVRLAKVAGILLAYPDLHLKIEGYTDNIGTPSYNVQLSNRRAASVRDYLVSQGVPASNVTAEGLGESNPVASNATAAGRQMNRRVDLVVSGQSIEATRGNSWWPGRYPRYQRQRNCYGYPDHRGRSELSVIEHLGYGSARE